MRGVIHLMQPATLEARSWCVVVAGLLGLMCASVPSRGQTLQTPQETNDKIKTLSASARIIPHDYIIGPGDTLNVDVFDVKELSRDVRVSQTGTIGLPLIPVRLHVKGLTETQAEQKIAEVLQANGLVSHPDVSVAVKERKSKPITVVGAVPHPMVYQAERPVTLLEVLAEAGGVANDAGDTAIITRPTPDPNDATIPPEIDNEDVIPPAGQMETPGGGAQVPAAPLEPMPSKAPVAPATQSAGSNQDAPIPKEASALSNTITVNLNELMESGNATNNIVLQAGDIVTVPHAGIVYVLGSVGRPGGFVLANDRSQMTVLKMLALAGGLNRTAKSDHAVIVRRDNQGQQHEMTVDLKKVVERKAEDVRLQSSDILYVPDSAAKRALVRASEVAFSVVTGAVLYRVVYR
jgi:polysaccharide export outer membrane protein